MALATLADIEKILHIKFGNPSDPKILHVLDAASAMVERFCNRTFEETSGINVTLDGTGREMLFLNQTPVTAVTSVTEGGTLLASTQYAWYSDGRLVRRNGDFDYFWRSKRQNVVVVYTGGFATLPDDLIYAATLLAADGFKAGASWAAQETPGVNLERIGDYMVQFDLDAAMANMSIHNNDGVRAILNTYRRVVMV